MSRARVVFVSGLSGSGKSTAMAALEDLGFYCADNLPAPLVEQFLDLCAKATPPIEKIALALDAREAQFLTAMPAAIARVREAGHAVELIFLDSSDEALVRRYRETRRVHPLSPDGSVERGIAAERLALRDVALLADRVIDTSQLNVHQLKAAIVQGVSGQTRPTVVNVISFGFRYGTPEALELLFDVRFLPNPYFEVEPARADRMRRAGGGIRAEVDARRGLLRASARLAAVPATPLRQRGEGLRHDRGGLHGGAAPIGGGGRGVGVHPARGRPRGERRAPRRGEEHMKPGIVIVTHYRLGEEFLQALRLIVPDAPEFHSVSLEPTQTVEEMRSRIQDALKAADRGHGILVLTDMFGGTPSNIALSFLDEHRVEVVTGLNLPMLIKLATLGEEKPLDELAAFIKSYGQRNISVASELLPDEGR